MDSWNTTLLLGWPIFRGYVSFREGISGDLWWFVFFFDFQTFKKGDRNLFCGVIQCWFVKESFFCVCFFWAAKINSREGFVQDVGGLNKDKTKNILKKGDWVPLDCLRFPLVSGGWFPYGKWVSHHERPPRVLQHRAEQPCCRCRSMSWHG